MIYDIHIYLDFRMLRHIYLREPLRPAFVFTPGAAHVLVSRSDSQASSVRKAGPQRRKVVAVPGREQC